MYAGGGGGNIGNIVKYIPKVHSNGGQTLPHLVTHSSNFFTIRMPTDKHDPLSPTLSVKDLNM